MASTIVLITGANSGIGYATTKVLAQSSDRFHVIMACRSLDKANVAKSELEALGLQGKLSTVVMDVTDEKSVEAAMAHVEQQFGRLDVLVNNAALAPQVDNLKTRFQRCLETNVIGPAMVAGAFRPLLLRSPNPYSIYIGSGERSLVRNALQGNATSANIKFGDAYAVSKAALNMLAMVELRDYGSKGLKTFVVSPGFVRSNLRGTSEEQQSGWGKAGDPTDSGDLILDVIEGKREADMNSLVHKHGSHAW